MTRLPSRRRTGFALVLILGLLALVTILVVTFFTRARSGTSESAMYAQQADAEQLSALATQIVEAQIRAATTGGRNVAWASQPGMIRTWDTSGSLFPVKNYRLYSWDTLADTPAAGTPFLGDNVLNWKGAAAASYNATWCDLNSPVARPDPARSLTSATVLDYPVTTPPKTDASGIGLDPTNGVATNNPDSDPTNTTSPGIQGYSIDAPPGFSAGTAAGPNNNPAPMPVKWLYQLQDGTLTAPDAGGGTTQVTISTASKTNPIVGRVAYWTDDETCKVNLNTASEGTFWDTPRIASVRDAYMGRYQPAQNEFQRYPGHPAMTCLSAVFPNFFATPKSTPVTQPGVYELIPRIARGGSYAGSQQPDPIYYALIPDTNRLFASVDEFFYQPPASPAPALPAPRLVGTSIIDAPAPAPTDPDVTREINQKRFFLTTTSRAPETNLFNTPRISLWPITTDSKTLAVHTAATRMDAFDKLLSFCGTLWKTGTTPGVPNDYFFSRADPLSPSFDYASIPRNQDIYKYLTRLTDAEVPGYFNATDKKSLAGKYGAANRDELLTQTFDFVRSGPNLLRVSDLYKSGTAVRTHAGYTNLEGGLVNAQFAELVVPLQIYTDGGTHTKGMGNFRYISGVGLGFYAEKVEVLSNVKDSNDNYTPIPITTNPMDPASTATKPYRVRYTIRPQLLVQTHQPTARYAHTISILNSSHPATELRSLRYRASLGVVNPVITPSSGNGRDLNAAIPGAPVAPTIGANQVNMPWGRPCELTAGPDGNNLYDSIGTYLSSPSAFLIAPAGGDPGNLSVASPYRDGSASSRNSVAYRTATPIILEYDLPQAITNLSSASDKNKLWHERIEGLLTGTSTTSSSTGAFTGYYEDAPDGNAPGTAWTPRMVVPGMTINLELAFTGENTGQGSAFPDADVVQSLTVNFPGMTLPVPSQTYLNGSGNTNPTPALNYNQLKNGAIADIKTWSGYYDHWWFRQGFANRYLWPQGTTSTPLPINYVAGNTNGNYSPAVATVGDVVREQELDGARPSAFPSSGKLLGDWRLAALQPVDNRIPSTWFNPPIPSTLITAASLNPANTTAGYKSYTGADVYRIHNFNNLQDLQGTYAEAAHLVSGLKYSLKPPGSIQQSTYRQTSCNMADGALMSNGSPGDWNDEAGSSQGGAIFSMADSGGIGSKSSDSSGSNNIHWSYFNGAFAGSGNADGINDDNQFAFTYSPNRQMISSMKLGTLLTEAAGTTDSKPWQTLLFCPNSAAAIDGARSHPGAANPPDHTYADLFWMPVVDPYPISETLSTAGKINMNYQMEPFHHITRTTGMYALLKSTQITAQADSLAPKVTDPAMTSGTIPPSYKPGYIVANDANHGGAPGPSLLTDWKTRYPIAIEETLKGFKARFDAGKPFASASAISEMFLYPTAPLNNPPDSEPPAAMPTGPVLNDPNLGNISYVAGDGNIKAWWNTQRLTGDNTREQPYTTLYPRLTTKSNTFTVHVRTQVLKQRPTTTDWTKWDEGKDNVISEYRGSETIERYLSPNDAAPVDYVTDLSGAIVDTHYYYRTLQRSRFTR